MGLASSRIFSSEIQPLRYAIPSRQATFRPWRFSITSTKVEASARLSCVPVSSQAKPRPKTCTFSSPSFRNSWLTVVISSSPRAENLYELYRLGIKKIKGCVFSGRGYCPYTILCYIFAKVSLFVISDLISGY